MKQLQLRVPPWKTLTQAWQVIAAMAAIARCCHCRDKKAGAYEESEVYGVHNDTYGGALLLHCIRHPHVFRITTRSTFKKANTLTVKLLLVVAWLCAHGRVLETVHRRLTNLHFAKQWSYPWNQTIDICMLHFFGSSKAGMAGTNAQLLPYTSLYILTIML